MAGLLFFNGLREVDLRERGFGHHIAALIASPAKAQMSRGGSAALARALEAAVRERGGDIRLLTEPARIVVENGRAIGIETRDGESIPARQLVASALNPHQTFLELLDPSLVPREIRSRSRRSSTTCWRRCSRSTSISMNRRAMRRPRNHPELAQRVHGNRRPRPLRPVLRHHSSSRGRHDPADRDVGRVSDAVRPESGAGAEAHRVHVGEVPYRLMATRRTGIGPATPMAASCWICGDATRRTCGTR